MLDLAICTFLCDTRANIASFSITTFEKKGGHLSLSDSVPFLNIQDWCFLHSLLLVSSLPFPSLCSLVKVEFIRLGVGKLIQDIAS